MSLELPLTALAMEIAGTAARAVGAGRTLTFPLAMTAETDELMQAALDAANPALEAVSLSVSRDAPPTLTVTL